MANLPAHQFNLFNFQAIRPRLKVPISAARIAEAKALVAAGNGADAADKLREIREALEAFEARLFNNSKP
jgi:hypothetical protein